MRIYFIHYEYERTRGNGAGALLNYTTEDDLDTVQGLINACNYLLDETLQNEDVKNVVICSWKELKG